jgi:pimeloyl-ACP methyl ester carboxylesterase
MIRFTYRSIKALLFNRYILTSLILAAVFIAGIFANNKVFAPDLHRLYMESMMVNDQPPVVLIHGVLGSKLRDKSTHKDLWPGSLSRLFLSDYSDIAFDIDPDTLIPMSSNIEAYAISEGAVGKDFYGKIVRTLGDAAGYKLAKIGEPVDPKQKNYYIFHYDWRQDNALSARQLADFIDQIQIDYKNLALKVDIVAHSMGGLIARYYIRYGRQDVLDTNDFDKKITMYGGEKVRRVVLLGTPNLGSVKTLNLFITGVKIGLKHIGTETIATWPSLYQLFPHPLNNWIVTSKGKPLDRDLFDVETWRRFQWSIFEPKVRERVIAKYKSRQEGEKYLATLERYFEKRLERARRFVWSLTVPLPERHPWLTIFGGGCTLTSAKIVVEEVKGESLIRMFPEEITQPIDGVDYDILLLEPGDGSVTKASLLGRNKLDPSFKRHEYIDIPVKQSFFLCVKHNSLTGNLNFQDNLLNTLLSRDDP